MALCYRDRTYCMSDCVNNGCSRFASDAVKAAAVKVGLPICYTDLRMGCPGYLQPGTPDPNTASS